MSEYTTQEILQMIEDKGRCQGLGLAMKDLSQIDLSRDRILAELKRRKITDPDVYPAWVYREEKTGDILGANLEGAYFQRANLRGASLAGANLQGASLFGAKLQGASLWDANLQGADLQRSNLYKAILRYGNLGGANLQRASLDTARLTGAWMVGARLEGATLVRANLQRVGLDRANLKGTRLVRANVKEVDFFGIESAAGAHWYRVELDRTQMTAAALKPAIREEIDKQYGRAQEAYLALKSNFKTIGRYDDAAWAYRKERQMEKHTHWFRSARRYYGKMELTGLPERGWRRKIALLWFYLRHSFSYCADWAVELLCGYGESLSRTIRALFIVWVAFALFYGLAAGVWGPEQRVGDEVFRHITLNPFDLLWFSAGAMTTANLPGLQARSTPFMRFLMSLEPLLAIALTGLLGFVLGNRIRRS